MTSDRIFVNGDIRTLDERNPNAQGLAAWRGRIVALGSNDDVLSLRTSRTEVVDLRGRVVLPGFTDAHAHFLGFSLQHTGRYVDLRQANSVEEALDAVRRLAEAVEDGEWIRGGRWDKNRWPTDAFPTRWQLDAVAPRNPTFLSNKDGHSVWVNSLALSAAGVTRETSAPEGGAILRDASGEPTGILQDAAIDLVARHLPPMDERQRRDALMEGMRAANALGVTGVHNCEGEDVFASFQELAREGRLTLRVVSHLPRAVMDQAIASGLRSGFGDERHRVGGVKLFVDGALGSQTAAMLEPLEYSDNRGLLQTSAAELRETVRQAGEAGLSCAVHAIGDLANRMTLDAFEHVRELSVRRGLRQRIEHAQHLTPQDVGRFARLGVTASMQPAHVPGDIDIAQRHLCARCRWAYAFASLLHSGANVAFGSDAPVETLDPLMGIHAAVRRRRWDETPAEGWYPQEALSAEDAVRCYTLGAALAAGKEDDEGSLTVGKLADFVVLSDDIFAVPTDRIRHARVEATVVGGDLVFERR